MVNYTEYIKSPEWKAKSLAAKERAGFRCQVCNRSASETILDAHHRTYERLGNERDDDIVVLCADCHELFEKSRRKKEPSPQYRKRKRKDYQPTGDPFPSRGWRNRPRQVSWDE